MSEDEMLTKSEIEKMTNEEIFKRYEKLSGDFHKKLNEIQVLLESKTGKSAGELKEYYSNPDNFSKEEWNSIQSEKKQYEKDIIDLCDKIGFDYKKYSKQKQSDKNKKKSKNVAMRKKNWLSLR